MKCVLLAILAMAMVAVSACDGKKKTDKKPPEGDEGKPYEKLTIGGANPVVEVETSMGKFKLELFEEKAPITVKNFLSYVDDKFYDGTIFHRVIPNFMVQGGGFEPGMREKNTKDQIENEAGNGIPNQRGTIAMARTNDPNSATAQFFVNVKDNVSLNRTRTQAGYAVFGQVLDGDGMAVVDKIRRVNTGSRGGHDDVPIEDVVVLTVRRVDTK